MLNTEQILALAPDTSSASAGKSLARRANWVSAARDDAALWGECKGSGAKPYQTAVDLGDFVSKCSCPSRKLPCKHGLGLMLLAADAPAEVAMGDAPDWVTAWLDGRKDRTEKKVAKEVEAATPNTELDEATLATRKKAAEKTAKARENKVARGVEELDLWMRDLVRGGLSDARTKPYGFWDTMGARLVDAQAGGLARRVRALSWVSGGGGGADWQARLLTELGRLRVLVRAYQNCDHLPETTQTDVRAAIGFTTKTEELDGLPVVSDVWQVVGVNVYEEEKLRVQKTYLFGLRSAQIAMLLHFSAGGQPFAETFADGMAFDGDLTFYPSLWPMRAHLKRRGELISTNIPANVFPPCSARDVCARLGEAVAQVPWTEDVFAIVPNAVLALDAKTDKWTLHTAGGDVLPIWDNDDTALWLMLAVSGGRAWTYGGEWNGRTFQILSQFGADAGAMAEGGDTT